MIMILDCAVVIDIEMVNISTENIGSASPLKSPPFHATILPVWNDDDVAQKSLRSLKSTPANLEDDRHHSSNLGSPSHGHMRVQETFTSHSTNADTLDRSVKTRLHKFISRKIQDIKIYYQNTTNMFSLVLLTFIFLLVIGFILTFVYFAVLMFIALSKAGQK